MRRVPRKLFTFWTPFIALQYKNVTGEFETESGGICFEYLNANGILNQHNDNDNPSQL